MTYSATKSSGFTLVETLTYAAGLLVILAGIVTFIFYLYDWYRSATVTTRTDQVGISLINRVLSDVRGADTANDAGSIYNNQYGATSLTTSGAGVSTTTVYSLEGGALKQKVNSSATTTLTAADMWISGFYVKKLTTAVSSSVRAEISIDYRTRSGTSTATYSGMAVLRQSYQ